MSSPENEVTAAHALAITPAPTRYFAPLVGLRKGQEWQVLLGWELEPAVDHPHQQPKWKLVRWGGSGPYTIQAAFEDSFGPWLDRLRYVGRWIPTSGINTATGFDYGAAWDDSLLSADHAPSFDQAVVLRWSVSVDDAHPHDHNAEWIEGALLFAGETGIEIKDLDKTAVVRGQTWYPAGFPARDGEETLTGLAELTLAALEHPKRVPPLVGDFVYGKLQFAVNGTRLGNVDTDWNGYGSTGAFRGVGRLLCNSKLCAPAPVQPWGAEGRTIADGTIQWAPHPAVGLEAQEISLIVHTRQIIPEPGATLEVVQRSHALPSAINIGSSLGKITWSPKEFAEWFTPPQSPPVLRSDKTVFLVAFQVGTSAIPQLLKRQAGDLGRLEHSGTLGDSASFLPHVSLIEEFEELEELEDGKRKPCLFICTISGTQKGDVDVEWNWAQDSGSSRVWANLPRFAFYQATDCARIELQLTYEAAWLPRFIGWHGLDLECFIKETTILAPPAFRRSEGSLTLELKAGQSSTAKLVPATAPATTDFPARPVDGRIRSGVRRLSGCEHQPEVNPFLAIDGWHLPVDRATPYTRDLRPADLLSTIDTDEVADFDESPILIQLPDKAQQQTLSYTMAVNEACEPPRVRNLRLELLRDSLAAGELFEARRFLVLDRTPFLMAQVELPPLARNDGFNSGVVARRVIDAETGQPLWEIALDTASTENGVRVTLPAQAIGEEMLLQSAFSKDPLPYRFGAPARLNLAPTYNPQRYAAIPWDLRRLFGYPGQRDPGAEVKTMEFELLYGLTASFSARDAELRVRVAELFARLGSLPGGLAESLPWQGDPAESEAFLSLRKQWRSVARRFAARLGILQPWSPATPDDLVLARGIEFTPRMQVDETDAQNPKRFGAQIYLKPDLDHEEKLSKEVRDLHDPDGLLGGFPFGMQEWEAPFYQLFWDNRRSSSAEVRDLAFSSLGGWGHQIARFAGNRLLIQARVAMGRTHVYTVERIGKIGVFGHKAKHVIRYERSTVPSPFSLDFPGGQPGYEGRPVLRKMEEYIELLDHRKDYPDRATALPLDTGMVRACYFPPKGTHIPISPSWGRVLEEGMAWEVPLWRSNADPFLYPKPEIFLEMVSGAGENARGVAQTIANPQDVYFYTTAAKGLTDDVTKWPIVARLDYLPAEEPTEWEQGEPFPEQDNVPDAGWPEAVGIPPGFERFTFQLDRSEDEVNLVANRRDDVMLHGRVRNVTMMRSVPTGKAKAPDSASADLKVAAQNVTKLRTWQRRAHYGLGEARAVLLRDAGNAAGKLDAALAAVNARLPAIEKMKIPDPPAPARPPGISAAPMAKCVVIDPVTGREKNPILARAITWAGAELRAQLEKRGKDLAETVFGMVRRQVEEAEKAANQFTAEVLKRKLQARIEEARAALGRVVFLADITPDRLLTALDQQLEHALAAPLDRVEQLIDLCTGRLEELATVTEEYVEDGLAKGRAEVAKLGTRVTDVGDRITSLLDDLIAKIPATPLTPWAYIHPEAVRLLQDARAAVVTLQGGATGQLTTLDAEFEAAAKKGAGALSTRLRNASAAVRNVAMPPLKVVRDTLLQLRQAVSGLIKDAGSLRAIQDQLRAWVLIVDGNLQALSTAINGLSNDLAKLIADAKVKIDAAHADVNGDIETKALDWAQTAQGVFCPLCNLDLGLPDLAQNALDTVENFGAIKDAWDHLKSLQYPRDAQKALDELDALEHRLGVESSWLGREVMPAAQALAALEKDVIDLGQEGSEVLRTVRSICNDLRTDGLGLNRKTLAMVLNFRAPTINLTPALAKLNQFGKDLGSLGLRLPTTELADRFLPNKDWLPKFDFNRIISDCGGAKLAGLLSRLKMPAELGDHIRVTQGLDKRTLRAWVLAEVDAQLSGRQSLFDFGPITVALDGARFVAHLRAEVDAGGKVTKDASGSIVADWVLLTGGQELVSFLDTALVFNNGQMRFDLDPKKIRLGGLLKMISDLTKMLPTPSFGKDSPLKVEWLKEDLNGLTLPVGVRATLELPKIDAGTTPVAVTGIQIGGYLELRALEKQGNALVFEFLIALGFHLSRKAKPFNIAIFCLGGGGWVDAVLEYRPLKSDLTATITVGISASASISFNIGWLSGGVGIYLGLFVEFSHHSPGGSSFGIGLVIVLDGYVDLCGIIEVYLSIRLEAVYRIAGGKKSLDCTGTVDVSIKICWCFTLHVSRSFTYSMGDGGGGNRRLMKEAVDLVMPPRVRAARIAAADAPAPPPNYEALAAEYLAMLA